MKKFIKLVTVVLCCMVLIGCGNDGITENNENGNETVIENKEETATTETDTPEPVSEEVTEESEGMINETTYVFLFDRWDMYVATPVAGKVMKLEHWSRFIADQETPFELKEDMGMIKTDDEKFLWLDDSHKSFEYPVENDIKERKSEYPSRFTAYEGDIPFIGNKEIVESKSFGFQYDRWDAYIASEVSENIVKIECWTRFIADDQTPFTYSYDVCTINTSNAEYEFEWLDDNHTGFIVKLDDKDNVHWEEGAEECLFTNDVSKYIVMPSEETGNPDSDDDSDVEQAE